MKTETTEAIDIQTMAGKTISTVRTYDGRTYPCSTQIPDEAHICTFVLQFGKGEKKQTWLVLDDYGNDWLDPDLEKHYQDTPYTVAINKQTGEVCLMLVALEERPQRRELGAVLFPLIPASNEIVRVPEEWLARLDELKCCKRPYHLLFLDNALLDFISREIGYQTLMEAIVIDLDFEPRRLQISCDSYREVSGWRWHHQDKVIAP